MWSMISGVSCAWPESRGDGDALSDTLLNGVDPWRLRRGRLKLLLCCGVPY
jgi:hypothetical protein